MLGTSPRTAVSFHAELGPNMAPQFKHSCASTSQGSLQLGQLEADIQRKSNRRPLKVGREAADGRGCPLIDLSEGALSTEEARSVP